MYFCRTCQIEVDYNDLYVEPDDLEVGYYGGVFCKACDRPVHFDSDGTVDSLHNVVQIHDLDRKED